MHEHKSVTPASCPPPSFPPIPLYSVPSPPSSLTLFLDAPHIHVFTPDRSVPFLLLVLPCSPQLGFSVSSHDPLFLTQIPLPPLLLHLSRKYIFIVILSSLVQFISDRLSLFSNPLSVSAHRVVPPPDPSPVRVPAITHLLEFYPAKREVKVACTRTISTYRYKGVTRVLEGGGQLGEEQTES